MTRPPATHLDNVLQISFLIGNLNKEHGGAQQLLYDLCTHLPSDEFETTVYYMFGEGTFQPAFEAVGTQVVALQATSNYDPRAFVRLVRHLRTSSPHILHTNSPISGVWGRAAGKIVDVPRLLSVEHHIHDARRPIARAVDDVTLPLTDAIVGVSEAVTDSFAPWERFLLDVADTRIDTIPNGVDVQAIDAKSQNSDNTLDPYPVEPSDPIVGTVGRHVEEKGYRYLIDAMVDVTRKYPDAKLLLIGDGPERTALEQRARRQGLLDTDGTDVVVFVGQQSSVPPFLAHFDVGAFSSVDESFGLALAEAMATGVPVVGTNIPAFRRILDDGEAGVLVPPHDSDALADAIDTLLSDSSNRERLGIRGRERIERCFSIEHTAREYAELYRNAMEK
jgi:glycosyltransferase involved in cell wall biosynthesis